ncbi:MAG: hypothetical protein IJ568_05940 [Bacilli bacterium]|nr:hypothetical protein [Bacilli bacterium]
MKNKVLKIFVLLVAVLTLTACFDNNKDNKEEKDNKDALSFKNDYEQINGTVNSSGKEHRTITISEKNVFVETTPEEIIRKIENKDSFYVYFGSRLCPWCRSTLEMADKISRENDIEKIYYIDIWDDEGNEIFRDKYTLDENGELVLSYEGTSEYKKIVEYLSDYLSDYTLTNENGEVINTNEKRIYAPNYVYISKGKAVRLITGISENQKGSRDELTEEILKDEEEIFNNFFVNACDNSC